MGNLSGENEPVVLVVRESTERCEFFWASGRPAGWLLPSHASSPQSSIVALRRRAEARSQLSMARSNNGPPTPCRPVQSWSELRLSSLHPEVPDSRKASSSDIRVFAKVGILSKLLMFEPADVIVVPLQLTFIFGIWVTLLGVCTRSRVVLVSKFTTEIALQLLQSAIVLPAVPTMLRALSSQKAIQAPFLRQILTGGEPFGVSLATTLRASFPLAADIYDLSSSRDGSCDFCLARKRNPTGFVRSAFPRRRFRIVPAVGQSIAAPESFRSRPRRACSDIFDEPEMTANAFCGSYSSRRSGSPREDGFVELVGRSKDIISRGGNKIAPLKSTISLPDIRK